MHDKCFMPIYSYEESTSSILPLDGIQYCRKCLDQVKFEELHGNYEYFYFQNGSKIFEQSYYYSYLLSGEVSTFLYIR